MQKVMTFNDVATATVKRNYFRINFLYMSKGEAINLLINADLTENSETL